MNKLQKEAIETMRQWLADESNLGVIPAKVEIAGEFDMHGRHYFIMRYKKMPQSRQWLLGVCGDYGEEILACSNMEAYKPETALEEATKLVEQVHAEILEAVIKELEGGIDDEDEEETGAFVGFVLLEEAQWDPEKLRADLLSEWGLVCEALDDDVDREAQPEEMESLIFKLDGMMAMVSLMDAPVPDGEAETNAENNYMWPEAVAVTKTHKAHLIVAVVEQERPLVDVAKAFTKLCAVCTKQPGVLGVYTSGTVFQPEFYQEVADWMKEDPQALPIMDWVFVNLYLSEKGVCAYTYGLGYFGKDEIEVLDAPAEASDVQDFLLSVANFVLYKDITLRDGETIGFTEDQILPITRSPGEALEGMTLKIASPGTEKQKKKRSKKGMK